jgi:hypothetical protein
MTQASVPATPDPGRPPAGRLDPEQSPFERARTLDKRLKLFLWGDSGVGKTTLALQFPRPVVLDLEGGTDLYGDAFEFDVRRVTAADEVMTAVRWLLAHHHPYRTLVLDPVTVYWDALQRKWSDIFLRRNKGSKGYKFEFYDLQPRDWMTLKAEFKELIRTLIALDMNVIVTARQKVQYADGTFMRAIGETFDGEKSLPYLFDTIVRLYRDDKGRFLGQCLKDRSNRLPRGEFEVSYQLFAQQFGEQALAREARPVGLASEEQKQQIREYIDRFRMTPMQVAQRLAAYGALNLDELSEANARLILEKFHTALAAKGESQVQREETR